MSPVFSHGRLRLYLLKLLDESPRHGYDVIRLLEDRFMGLYAPSPAPSTRGWQRLEAEGLVTQTQEGGRKVYQITDAGREELAGRQDELDELEAEISGSVHGLAREIRDEVRGTVRDLKQELRQAAREIRREQRHENRSRRGRHDDHHRWEWHGEGLDGRLWRVPGPDPAGDAAGPAHRDPGARVRRHPRRGVRAHPPDPQGHRRTTPRTTEERTSDAVGRSRAPASGGVAVVAPLLPPG